MQGGGERGSGPLLLSQNVTRPSISSQSPAALPLNKHLLCFSSVALLQTHYTFFNTSTCPSASSLSKFQHPFPKPAALSCFQYPFHNPVALPQPKSLSLSQQPSLATPLRSNILSQLKHPLPKPAALPPARQSFTGPVISILFLSQHPFLKPAVPPSQTVLPRSSSSSLRQQPFPKPGRPSQHQHLFTESAAPPSVWQPLWGHHHFLGS